MRGALNFFSDLPESVSEWILNNGVERHVMENTSILREGTRCDALFIVLEGLLSVSVSATRIATLGPGELLGDISFVENVTASASVDALESSLLLEIPHATVEEKIRKDCGFAAEFYRALARLNAHRLRNSVSAFGSHWGQNRTAGALKETWEKLEAGLEQFKSFMVDADTEALKNDNIISDDTINEGVARFRDFCLLLNSLVGDSAPENPSVKAELGSRVRAEILPYLSLTQTAERFYSKPRGYAGDFFTIELIYQNQPAGVGRIGKLVDKCFLEHSTSKAVRNRRALLAGEILEVVKQNQPRASAVTSLACGPAEELFDAFEDLDQRDRLKASCLDIDLQALAFVLEKRDKRRLQTRMQLINANLVYLALGKQKLDLAKQDLIYSIGLIDYFSDKLVIKLLNSIYGWLRLGGKIILGNFHPRNSSKALMDYVLDWKLIHRSEEDMNRLFEESAFRRPATAIRFEEEGINLFAECIRSS